MGNVSRPTLTEISGHQITQVLKRSRLRPADDAMESGFVDGDARPMVQEAHPTHTRTVLFDKLEYSVAGQVAGETH
eukprot:COSAG02_NODE_4617_length_5158_cov_85.227911_4_plen_76_part_00